VNWKLSTPPGYTVWGIRNCFHDAPVYYTTSTTSTMDDARVLISRGVRDGTVVCTGYQSAGKGRLGRRTWESAPGENLLFTLIRNAEKVRSPVSRFPLLTGLALCFLYEKEYQFFPSIKWPNDLLYKDKKLAGILCTTEKNYILCGIGMNANQSEFPGDLSTKAISIRMITREKVDRMRLCEKALAEIKETLDMPDWQRELEKRLYNTGKKIKVIQQGEGGTVYRVLEGILSGIDQEGALLIKNTETCRVERVFSGEVSYNV
jgi:BirA family transcriptional regulator, biotin operon repressor / biotin---[acetyl-CoA-carboxylase] ligase